MMGEDVGCGMVAAPTIYFLAAIPICRLFGIPKGDTVALALIVAALMMALIVITQGVDGTETDNWRH